MSYLSRVWEKGRGSFKWASLVPGVGSCLPGGFGSSRSVAASGFGSGRSLGSGGPVVSKTIGSSNAGSVSVGGDGGRVLGGVSSLGESGRGARFVRSSTVAGVGSGLLISGGVSGGKLQSSKHTSIRAISSASVHVFSFGSLLCFR